LFSQAAEPEELLVVLGAWKATQPPLSANVTTTSFTMSGSKIVVTGRHVSFAQSESTILKNDQEHPVFSALQFIRHSRMHCDMRL
jgi:hypothetical protein